jgi:hypothetical protein
MFCFIIRWNLLSFHSNLASGWKEQRKQQNALFRIAGLRADTRFKDLPNTKQKS